jgi:hypothetical protein
MKTWIVTTFFFLQLLVEVNAQGLIAEPQNRLSALSGASPT